MALDEYRRKRKFDRTPEPRGARKPVKKAALRFVVQMHHASRLHFDFRLEFDGVLKSWAVPRGPSLSPLDQRLAVLVEDHPIEYGDFEGIIPKGNYGAGTVVLWDRGTYVERGSKTRAESEVALRKGLAAGHITFVLDGQKLRGEFALVRLKNAREPNAWLLLKKRDRFSNDRPDRQPGHESVKTGRTIEKIAKEAAAKGEVWLPGKGPLKPLKPMKAAKKTHAATVEHAPKRMPAPARDKSASESPRADAIPRRVKPMLPAAARGEATVPGRWLTHAQPDGIRAIAEVDASGAVRMHSKSLLALKAPAVASALATLKRALVLDGFLEADRRFTVIDLLYSDGADLRAMGLEERLRRLDALAIFLGPIARAERGRGRGLLLARDPASPYVSGVSKHWLSLEGAADASTKKESASSTSKDGPTLTHLEKILWPADGTTKRDLIEYYRAVAPALVPHLRDRPESMHRHPHGIGSKGFFQKDLSGYYPRWIKTAPLYSAHSQRTINFLVCNDERTLLYMANSGCIELNPWLSRTPSLDRPDFCVIDLDPSERQGFSVVIEVALEVKRVLDAAGAESFVKTSGSSGLHIYVPTGAECDYDFSRGLALAACQVVHERLPKLTSLERTPSRRGGKLYLDCFQNARGQTLASAYCVRPLPGAPVSAPLKWSEVKRGLDPRDFTIRTMPARLRKLGDLWAPLLKARASLSRLKKILTRLEALSAAR